MSENLVKVLLTGAGGAAAVSILKAVSEQHAEFYAADMDPHAAGLYLVPQARRLRIPSAVRSDFSERLLSICIEKKIEVLWPTVDAELEVLAKHIDEFQRHGIQVLSAGAYTLQCLDKWKLLEMCRGAVSLPRTERFGESFTVGDWEFPLIIKPRRGSGSRGVVLVRSKEELEAMARSEELLVQEYLPGVEYSVDILTDSSGGFVAAVPRERMKVDSGVAVASRTVRDTKLIAAAKKVAAAIQLSFVGNIQFRRRRNGEAVLLEVNPRFPGTMPLTVKAGVNMPLLALKSLLGEPLSGNQWVFREIAVVRYWHEHFVELSEVEQMERTNPAGELDAPGSQGPGVAPRMAS